MLGSDPLAALLGAATDPRSSQTVWKAYLRRLVTAGAAVTMMGPDVTVPDGADDAVLEALARLIQTYPPGSQMPAETTGMLSEMGVVDVVGERVNRRVTSYWRHIASVLGRDLASQLIESGAITASAGLHVGASGMIAVSVPDGEAMDQWRSWSASPDVSNDPREAHSAPTIVLPTAPGGGVYLFRTADPVPADLTIPMHGSVISTGDLVVPIPPTLLGGKPVTRRGPARMLPDWLRTVIENAANSSAAAEPVPALASF